jgi:hypothetical protein
MRRHKHGAARPSFETPPSAAPQDEVVKSESPPPEEPIIVSATIGVSKDGPLALKLKPGAETRLYAKTSLNADIGLTAGNK